MGIMEWEGLLDVQQIDDLSSQERVALCKSLAECHINSDASKRELKRVLILAQTLLNFRGDQVEQLRAELEENEGKHEDIQERLRQEISELQQQANSGKKSRRAADARQEAARLQRQNKELQTELESLRKQQQRSDMMVDAEEEEERAEKEQKKLNKTLELQTGHISQLLADLEGVEAENAVLKERLASVRDKLAEATEALSQSTSELTFARNLCLEFKGKSSDLQSEKEALRLQVSELVSQRSQLDQQLQEFRNAVDVRVDKWKDLMDKKEAEIVELRAQILVSQPDQTSHLQETITALNQAIATRDEQVEELSQNLAEATEELSDCATTLEQIRHNKSDGESLRVWHQLQAALERERIMEGRLREAEQDASVHAQEVTCLSNELRRLELGELGLTEALAETRELRKALGIRDSDIEKLVQANNALQTKLDESADQILVLRNRCGLGSEDEIDVSSVSEHREGNRRRTEALLSQVAQLEAERLALKLQNRDLQRHLQGGELSGEVKLETVHEEEIGSEMQSLLEENESLRKGMHEILESVRSQDGSSEVRLESSCLERLLEALDARHIAGWYHPAMRLQAQLHCTQGIAAELREQLRLARDEEKNLRQQLLENRPYVVVSSNNVETKPESDQTQSSPRYQSKQSGEWATSMRGEMQEILGLMSQLQNCMPPLATTWQDQLQQTEEQLADIKADAEELKRHLDEGDHSVAVCAARAASQRLAERTALRKCHSLGAAYARVSAQNNELVIRSVQKEIQLTTQIAQLRDTESELKKEVSLLQNALSVSVSSDEMRMCQSTLDSTSEKLRELLLQQETWGCERETMKSLPEELNSCKAQVQSLQEELVKERTKLNALEAQTANIELDHQLLALSEKLATAEQNEVAAKQRAEHESKMCNLLREQVRELEVRRQHLEKSVLSHFSVPLLSARTEEIGEIIAQVDDGRCARLEEALAAAQHQVATMQSLVDARHLELESLREQTTELQGVGDLQATLGRMGEELLSLRLSEAEAKNQIGQAQRTSTHLQSRCLHLEYELRLSQSCTSRVVEKSQNTVRNLRQRLLELCLRHRACVPIDTLELTCRWLREARNQAKESREIRAREDTHHNTSSANSEEQEMSDEKSWHARALQLQALNHESERRAARLTRLLVEETERAKRLEQHAQQLEDERLEIETHWQRQLISWQLEHCYGSEEIKSTILQTQTKKISQSLEVEDAEEEKQDSEKPTDTDLQQEEQDTPNSSQAYKSIEEAELNATEVVPDTPKTLRRQSSSQDELKLLQSQLKSKETLIIKLKSQVNQQAGTGQRAKLALEAMISSLSELVSLKEAALGRARQRLRDAHSEHANVARALRQQAAELRDSLAKVQTIPPPTEVPATEGSALTRLLTQVHELEDELRVANRGAGALAGQLRVASSDAQRWRDLAETRQARLQKLQERYEAEIEEAVAARLSKPSAWIEKADVEVAEKDENPELQKAYQENKNLKERLSQCEEEMQMLQKQIDTIKTGETDSTRISFREGKDKRAAQEKLRTQLKQLQSDLEEARAKQQAALDLHKFQTSEGVSRWEERKKLQANCEKLRIRVQALESDAERAQRSNDALRSLVERLERDKATLEVQLRKKSRAVTVSSTVPLQAEITRLRERLSSSEDACAGLRRQLEHQRRLAEDSVRLRDEISKLRRELEREKEVSLTLQGRNTRLEATNLEINLRLESARNEMSRGSEDVSVSREELQRSVLVLGQHVRKLQAKLRSRGATTASLDSSLESPHGSELSARLNSTLKRKASLESEIASVRAENAELNSRLQQKVCVLVEIRAALQEASLREAALTSEISNLRSLLSQ